MAALNITDVTRIATEAAREQSSHLKVVGVTLGSGEGDYVEVLIEVTGCRKDPCRFSVGVFRSAPGSVVHDEIADTLRRHLREHAA
jgi:hypothetical protein